MTDTADFTHLSAAALGDAYRQGSLSPVEVTEACLRQIERLNPELNAFCLVAADSARAAAKASEQRWRRQQPLGPLDGVPVSIKDLMLTQGWPTLRGSLTVKADQPWADDSPPVARLREAGAVLLGKTTTPEFAWKGVTDSPLTGISRNPWDPTRTPGGSSGGAAAAVASGMGPLAVGTDAGGSLRIPASFCGIFTIKPGGGRVPTWPPTPYGSFASTGPMTRTVRDAALLLDVLAQPDYRDWQALPPPIGSFRAALDQPLRRPLRAAFAPNLGTAQPAPAVLERCTAAVQALAAAGIDVEPVDQVFDDAFEIYETLRRGFTTLAFAQVSDEAMARMDPGLAEEIRVSRATASLPPFLKADRARTDLALRLLDFHRRYDLLLTPTLAVTAFATGRRAPDSHPLQQLWNPYCYPFNLTKQPAASVPCGFDAAGLPVGLQIVGPPHSEALVLQAAALLEQAMPWAAHWPAVN